MFVVRRPSRSDARAEESPVDWVCSDVRGHAPAGIARCRVGTIACVCCTQLPRAHDARAPPEASWSTDAQTRRVPYDNVDAEVNAHHRLHLYDLRTPVSARGRRSPRDDAPTGDAVRPARGNAARSSRRKNGPRFRTGPRCPAGHGRARTKSRSRGVRWRA